MEVASTVINAAVVATVGLILGWLGKRRFDAIDRRLDAFDWRFDAIDRPFEPLDQRIDRLEARLDQRIHGLQESIDAMGAELREVVVALGVSPPERCPVTRPLSVRAPDDGAGMDWVPCHPRRRTTSGRTSAIRS